MHLRGWTGSVGSGSRRPQAPFRRFGVPLTAQASRPLNPLRLFAENDAPLRPDGRYVLYWMVGARRTRHSHALEHAVYRAAKLSLPLLVLEALRVDYPHASPRLHSFVLDGMVDNRQAFKKAGIPYYPYVEPKPGAGSGLVASLAEHAAVIVSDRVPSSFVPRMVSRTAQKMPVRLETVDSIGVVPLRAPGKAFLRALDFRRYLQRNHLDLRADFPSERPLAAYRGKKSKLAELVEASVLKRWTPSPLDTKRLLAELPLQGRADVVKTRGGSAEAETRLTRFLDRLERYADRNHPDDDTTSGLSPYLHFGHIGATDVLGRVLDREDWSPPPPPDKPPRGAREGFYGLSTPAEEFMDELVTWRELGQVFAHYVPDHASFGHFPAWANATMDEHRKDPRPYLASFEQLERGETKDQIWNAAQRQLVDEGTIHNYMRMLWGKKVYEWSSTPEEAWERLVLLNDRWALDGRDANSYAGIGWVFGRFDRAWGPERPIFGKLRYMTSDATVKKLRVGDYLLRHNPPNF